MIICFRNQIRSIGFDEAANWFSCQRKMRERKVRGDREDRKALRPLRFIAFFAGKNGSAKYAETPQRSLSIAPFAIHCVLCGQNFAPGEIYILFPPCPPLPNSPATGFITKLH